MTTIVAAVSIVGIFTLGVAALTTAGARADSGRGAGPARLAGYACVGVAALIARYGLYLIIPQFHS
ncbi:MAG TPA: hypothetical protein VFC16_15850 [Nakamurella sp.]|nr:hypothetical protein [Nakamurella sp.]